MLFVQISSQCPERKAVQRSAGRIPPYTAPANHAESDGWPWPDPGPLHVLPPIFGDPESEYHQYSPWVFPFADGIEKRCAPWRTARCGCHSRRETREVPSMPGKTPARSIPPQGPRPCKWHVSTIPHPGNMLHRSGRFPSRSHLPSPIRRGSRNLTGILENREKEKRDRSHAFPKNTKGIPADYRPHRKR